jgi:hypothetical protein
MWSAGLPLNSGEYPSRSATEYGFFIDEWVNFNIHGSDLIYSDGWVTR